MALLSCPGQENHRETWLLHTQHTEDGPARARLNSLLFTEPAQTESIRIVFLLQGTKKKKAVQTGLR